MNINVSDGKTKITPTKSELKSCQKAATFAEGISYQRVESELSQAAQNVSIALEKLSNALENHIKGE